MTPLGKTQRLTRTKSHPQALLAEAQRLLRNKKAQNPTLVGKTFVKNKAQADTHDK